MGAALRTPADVFGFFAEQTPSTTTKEKDKETRKRDFVDDGTDVRSGIIVGNQGRRAILSTPFPRRMIEFWRLVVSSFYFSTPDGHLRPARTRTSPRFLRMALQLAVQLAMQHWRSPRAVRPMVSGRTAARAEPF